MSSLLREQYKSRLLEESKRVSLVLEALDPQQVQNVADAIDALEKLIPSDKMPTFYKAVQSAKTELGKTLAGGIKTAVVQKFTQPVGKAIALADGLKSAFRMLPQLVKSFVPQNQQNITNKPIQQLIDKGKSKQFADAFLNAVRPSGVVATLGKLFGKGGIPFMDNPNAAVYEMMQKMSIDDLQNLASNSQSVPQAASQEVAKEIQAASQQPQQSTQPTAAKQEPQTVATEYEKFKGIIPNLSPEQKQELTKLLNNAQPFAPAKN